MFHSSQYQMTKIIEISNLTTIAHFLNLYILYYFYKFCVILFCTCHYLFSIVYKLSFYQRQLTSYFNYYSLFCLILGCTFFSPQSFNKCHVSLAISRTISSPLNSIPTHYLRLFVPIQRSTFEDLGVGSSHMQCAFYNLVYQIQQTECGNSQAWHTLSFVKQCVRGVDVVLTKRCCQMVTSLFFYHLIIAR